MSAAFVRRLALMGFAACLALTSGAAIADTVATRLDEARQSYQKGDLPRTVTQLQAALAEVRNRLAGQVGKTMPPAAAGWEALEAEVQDLDTVGGGLTVSRAYQTERGESMNLSIIIDNPSVVAAAGLFTNPTTAQQPSMKRVKAGSEDALQRWDAGAASGEVMLVLGNRILVQVEGDGLKSPDAMVDLATRLNTGALRKLAGL